MVLDVCNHSFVQALTALAPVALLCYLSTNLNFLQVALNTGGSRNILAEGNFVNGAVYGYYGDSGPYTNITVSHNIFRNVYAGAVITGTPFDLDNFTFSFNNVENADSDSANAFGFGGSLAHP